jgi:hypothetical protein
MSEENKNAGAAMFRNLQNNPKLLYILIGVVAVGSLTMALMGGGDGGKVQIQAAISSGQSVTLNNPNGGLSHLTATPGLISASDAEEDSDLNVCKAPAGSHGTVEQETVVGLLPFVKVTVTDGECQGKTGWTSKVNVR